MRISPVNFNQNLYLNNSRDKNKSSVAFGMNPGPFFSDTKFYLLRHFEHETQELCKELDKLIAREDGAVWDLIQTKGNPNEFIATLIPKGYEIPITRTFKSPELLFNKENGLIKFLENNIRSNTNYQ